MNNKPYKVDKNGTQYYEDFTCDRCGGQGIRDEWLYTGSVCYKCGGTGQAVKARIIKVYTPEHFAKLEASRQRRHEKRMADLKQKALDSRQEMIQPLGFGADGKSHIVLGDTYSIKSELKEAGARYNREMGWHFLTKPEGYDTMEVSADDLVSEFPVEFLEEAKDIVDGMKKALKPEDLSDYVGKVKERLTMEFIHESSISYMSHGWNDEIEMKYIHKFRDAEGNLFVWFTTVGLEEGSTISAGTVKDHSEYEGTKQTVLTRCKVKV